MSSFPWVSIIMPTLNSEKTIELALISIRKQSYPQEFIEIVVADGGSEDQTRFIAQKHGAIILENPHVQQEYAKHIGLLGAKGKYAVFLDSDEILENDEAISNRVRICMGNSDIKVIQSGGCKKPPNAHAINDYINHFSDPFAFFMQGISGESALFLNSWKKKYKNFKDHPDFTEFELDLKNTMPEMDMCGGHTIDLEYLKKEFGHDLNDTKIVPRIFYFLIKKSHRTAILKNDAIIHYSADNYRKFLKKIKWRVIVNIHYKKMPGTGFSNHEEFQPFSRRLKKYLFIPYAFTLIGPLLISFYHAIRQRKSILLIHFPLTLYTASLIAWYFFLKILRIKVTLRAYGNEMKELNLPHTNH